MTQFRIVVSIAEGYITMDVMQPTATKGIRQAAGRWLAYLLGQEQHFERPAHSIRVAGSTSMQGLPLLFNQGLDALKKRQQNNLAGTVVNVVLGPSHAHVGILEMLATDGAKLSDSDKAAYVQAWVVQNWAVQPDECVLRWVPLGHSGRYMVTCIERYIVDAVGALCAQEAMRLSSCKPAVVDHLATLINKQAPLAAVATAVDLASMSFVVFIERAVHGGRTSMVQFMAVRGLEPLSVLRLWLPAERGPAADTEIDKVVQRLRAQYRSTEPVRADIVRWPADTDGVSKP